MLLRIFKIKFYISFFLNKKFFDIWLSFFKLNISKLLISFEVFTFIFSSTISISLFDKLSLGEFKKCINPFLKVMDMSGFFSF